MGAGASSYASVQDALKDGKSHEEVDAYLCAATNVIAKVQREQNLTLQNPVAVDLSPFDISNRGRTMPMFYYYADTLSASLLLLSLQDTLKDYPVFCGRYDGSKFKVNLNNEGVPFMVSKSTSTVHEAISHLLPSLGELPELTETCFFTSDLTDKLLHPVHKDQMDPDLADPGAPVLAIRCTLFEGDGTAIAISLQHGVGDADSQMSFMVNWSRRFRNLPLNNLAPYHNRNCYIDKKAEVISGEALEDQKKNPYEGLCIHRIKTIQPGEKAVPEFAPVMKNIMGHNVGMLPFHKQQLDHMKAAVSEGLDNGKYVSTDDILTAKIWQSLCKIRCKQVNVSINDANQETTLNRAFNIRNRVEPQLPTGYVGNAVTNVLTTMTVKELCCDLSIQQIALRLRETILMHTPEKILLLAKYHVKEQAGGAKTSITFDAKAMTFIVSSWIFPHSSWDLANFDSKPLCFGHACLVPIVASITSRANGSGRNVWHSGTENAVSEFVALMGQTLVPNKSRDQTTTVGE
eukprot:g11382.t1